jgi:predicted metal-dependent peptidase
MKKTTESEVPIQMGDVSDEDVRDFDLDPHLINLMLHEPFFSHILRKFNKNRDENISTAGIGVVDQNPTLFWNPRFLASLKVLHVRGLMKHECYHWIYKHVTSRKKEPHLLWNWATDLAINGLIRESELPDGGLIPGKCLDLSKITDPEQLKKWKKISDLIMSLPRGEAAEWYFGKLQEDPEISDTIQEQEEGQGAEVLIDDHGGWDEMSDEDRQIVEGKIRQAVSEAVKKCDRSGEWGSVPGSTREALRKMVSNSIPWSSLLKNFCGRSQRLNKSRTMKRINRKYPYIHSGVRRGHSANIAVYMDQSGSVGSDSVELLFAELNNLGKKINFTLFPFDSQVDEKNSIEWRRGQSVPPIRHRYGGTNFNAVAKHAKENSGKFDGYIVLTDGECSSPGPSRMRRAWVIIPGRRLSFDPPKGDIVISMDKTT